MRVAALAKRYSNDPKADLKALGRDYSVAMKSLTSKYPDDLDIATLYAESVMDLHPWKFWSHEGKPNEGTTEIVSTLESVLRRNPNHLGANHYYVHAIEASPHPERALASAARLKTLAPMSGHLVHMPAHIYQRTGNYAGAARANANAAATDRVFIKNHGGEGLYAAMYYNHNLQFGLASYAMSGRFNDAKTMSDEFAANATVRVRKDNSGVVLATGRSDAKGNLTLPNAHHLVFQTDQVHLDAALPRIIEGVVPKLVQLEVGI